jgi:hypothetical protein
VGAGRRKDFWEESEEREEEERREEKERREEEADGKRKDARGCLEPQPGCQGGPNAFRSSG